MTRARQTDRPVLVLLVHGFLSSGRSCFGDHFAGDLERALGAGHGPAGDPEPGPEPEPEASPVRYVVRTYPSYQTSGHNATQVQALMDWLLLHATTWHYGQIVLLGHSMGGLLCADAVRYLYPEEGPRASDREGERCGPLDPAQGSRTSDEDAPAPETRPDAPQPQQPPSGLLHHWATASALLTRGMSRNTNVHPRQQHQPLSGVRALLNITGLLAVDAPFHGVTPTILYSHSFLSAALGLGGAGGQREVLHSVQAYLHSIGLARAGVEHEEAKDAPPNGSEAPAPPAAPAASTPWNVPWLQTLTTLPALLLQRPQSLTTGLLGSMGIGALDQVARHVEFLGPLLAPGEMQERRAFLAHWAGARTCKPGASSRPTGYFHEYYVYVPQQQQRPESAGGDGRARFCIVPPSLEADLEDMRDLPMTDPSTTATHATSESSSNKKVKDPDERAGWVTHLPSPHATVVDAHIHLFHGVLGHGSQGPCISSAIPTNTSSSSFEPSDHSYAELVQHVARRVREATTR